MKKVVAGLSLVLMVCMITLLPTVAVAYLGLGYSGTPIAYGGWIIGQVYIEAQHVMRPIPWVKITVTSPTDSTFSKVTSTNEGGYYRVYVPPGNYTVTAEYTHYTQTYNITMREDAIYRWVNIYITRPDMPEYQDRLSSQ